MGIIIIIIIIIILIYYSRITLMIRRLLYRVKFDLSLIFYLPDDRNAVLPKRLLLRVMIMEKVTLSVTDKSM